LSGGQQVNQYNLAFTVNPTVNSKVANGSAAAILSGGTLSSTVNGDVITATNASFVSTNAGLGIVVTNVTLSGLAAGNYTLTQPAGLTGDIYAYPTWVNPAGGVWDTATNWSANVIASGSGGTADFSQLDLTADTTVSLASSRTIGNLTFGNTDASPAANWIVSNGGTYADTLVLAGSPQITVNNLGTGKSATINAVITGTAGFNKLGTGKLVLAGTNNYSGTTAIGAGEVDFSAGCQTNMATISVGNVAGSTGTMGITGGVLTMYSSGGFYLGQATGGAVGVGVVNQTGGVLSFTSANASFLVGNGSYSSGTYNLSGGTLQTTYSANNRGVMLGVNAGTNAAGNVATFNLSGTGILSLPSAALMVGRSDTTGATNLVSTYNQTGGSATVGTLTVGGLGAFTTGTFNVTGGNFIAGSFLTLVSNVTSTANITLGGSAQVTLPAFPAPIGTANLTLDFTTGWLAPLAASTNYLSNLTAANLTANGAKFNVGTGTNITVPQVLQNASGQAGTLAKSGAGVLTLSGANTYTGNTTISGGTLLVAKPGSLATGTVTVGSSATLGGSGLIKGPVSVSSGGTLAPDAAAISTLTISNTLTLNASSQTTMKISKTAATNDVVAGVSTLTFGGTLTVNNQAGTFVGGESYQLFNATSYSGNFTTTNLPALGTGLAWNWNPATGNLSVVTPATLPATGTNIFYSINGSGTTMTLSWPTSYKGWWAQSNSVDLTNPNDWHDITGSTGVDNLIINLDPSQANVFYRMRHP